MKVFLPPFKWFNQQMCYLLKYSENAFDSSDRKWHLLPLRLEKSVKLWYDFLQYEYLTRVQFISKKEITRYSHFCYNIVIVLFQELDSRLTAGFWFVKLLLNKLPLVSNEAIFSWLFRDVWVSLITQIKLKLISTFCPYCLFHFCYLAPLTYFITFLGGYCRFRMR